MRGGAGRPGHSHLEWLRLEKPRSPTTPPPHLGCDRNITIYQGHQHVVAGIYGLDRHLAGTGAIIWKILETGSLLGEAPLWAHVMYTATHSQAQSIVECSSWKQCSRHYWHSISCFLGLPFQSLDFATRNNHTWGSPTDLWPLQCAFTPLCRLLCKIIVDTNTRQAFEN